MSIIDNDLEESRAQQLRNLINELVEIISINGNFIKREQAAQIFYHRTGLSMSIFPYIVNSAIADHKITSNHRTGILSLYKGS